MIVVGCPVRKRDWILPTWREYVYQSFANAGLFPPYFLFVAGEDDHESVRWDDSEVLLVQEDKREDIRSWGPERYHHMVKLRNNLLSRVRELEPEFFLSLDSDILLHPDAMRSMLDVAANHQEAWAVGGKTNMDSGNYSPSYGNWNDRTHSSFRREPANDVRVVDIIMAVKLMRKSAYFVDYEWHRWGEDIGWSSAVGRNSGTLYWDGSVTSKHVMKPERLDVRDERCGY